MCKMGDYTGDLQVEQAATTVEIRPTSLGWIRRTPSSSISRRTRSSTQWSWRSVAWPAPLLVPMQHELTDHSNGGPLRGRMNAVEEWITTAKATNAANPQG